jgi:hypothetical protein
LLLVRSALLLLFASTQLVSGPLVSDDRALLDASHLTPRRPI